jgi:pimeloyl-ACP methyl ester carboxylesterase
MRMNNCAQIASPDSVEAPEQYLARIEAQSDRLTTLCGKGTMVWRSWGSGPPLVLLHGGYGSWRHWIRTIPTLAKQFRLLVPDLPGLGDSDELPESPLPEDIADTVRYGLNQIIPTDAPYDVVGFSFGALIGGHMAAKMGADIRSLTLVGAGALGLTRPDIPLVKWQSDLPADELRAIHRKNLSRLMIADPSKIDDLALHIQQVNTKMARVRSLKFAASDSLLQALRQSSPHYLNAIWGQLDAVAAVHMTERFDLLRGIRPDVHLEIIPKAGHWVAYEEADRFNALLSALLIKRQSNF